MQEPIALHLAGEGQALQGVNLGAGFLAIVIYLFLEQVS
jgi:hypothetical protein